MRHKIARQKIVFFTTVMAMSFASFAQSGGASQVELKGSEGTSLVGDVKATFNQPWAMVFLPDGQSLVTEKTGSLWLLDNNQQKRFEVTGMHDPKLGTRYQPGFSANGQPESGSG